MGCYKSDEERIEQLSEEVAEAERKIDDLRDEVSAQTARAEEAEASLAEREALLHECNAVCLCGCPESEHESYGEDGESCGHDDHECLRVPKSVLAYVETLRRTPASDEVREAAEWAAEDLGNVIYNIETGARREAEEQAREVRDALLAALSSPPAAPARDEVREAAARLRAARMSKRLTCTTSYIRVEAERVLINAVDRLLSALSAGGPNG